jgi:type II secretory pathway pseudopilin PulG
MTLLEILTVIVIFSMLLAITATFMQGANRDLGVAAAANHAVGVLRVAHQESRSTSAPSWVVLDTKQQRIYMLLKETVGEWHLEDMATTGAFGKDGKVSGGQQVQGRVGKAIQLGAGSTIAFGEVPYYEPDQGVVIEFWFLRHMSRGRGVLASIGKLVEVSVEPDGHVEAHVGSLGASSGQIYVPAEAWVYLQLVYSGRELKLILNRREVQSVPGKISWTPNVSFAVGGSGFNGIVDEVRLGLIVPRDEYLLPGECSIVLPPGVTPPASGEVVIAFDDEGRLAPSVTPQPFTFSIKSPADTKTITIGPGGTLQR